MKSYSKNENNINTEKLLLPMTKKEVLANLIDNKKRQVLQVLLHSQEELVLKEITAKSSVPSATTFRILQELVAQNILHRREWKNSKVYSCQSNEKIDFLKELFSDEYDGVSEFVELASGILGIQNILLHESRKGSANLLIIGENFDMHQLEEASRKVRTKGFDLTYLPLSRKQYEQMAKMGLYGGEKKVLK